MRARVSRMAAVMTSAVALAAAGSAAAGSAAARGPSLSPKPGQWTQVTAARQLYFTDVGLVRGPDGVLHVIWSNGTVGSYSVYDTPIQPGGAAGRPVIITGHLNQATFPDATGWGGKLHAFWNQLSNASPVFSGTAIATWPAGGRHWDPVTGVSHGTDDAWGASVAAATGADGQPWVTFTDDHGIEVSHYGHVRRLLDIPDPLRPGIGVDGRTAAAWLTWYSAVPHKPGLYVQRLGQNASEVGPAIRLPGSETGGHAIEPNQRTPSPCGRSTSTPSPAAWTWSRC